jgi:hypothetical protein
VPEFLLIFCVVFTIGRFGKKIAGAFKKIVGLSSSPSHGSSSAHFTEPEESPMHEDKETTPTEE